MAYLANMSHESALIRRSSAACLIVICRHSRYPLANARFLIITAIGRIPSHSNAVRSSSVLDQLLEHYHQNESNRLINGYLGLIKNLIQFLGSHMKESGISLPSTNPAKNPDVNEQHLPISIRQIIEVKSKSSPPCNCFSCIVFF